MQLQHAFVQCNLAATISTAVLISVVYLAVTPLVHAADESPVSQSPNDLIFSDGGQALQLQLESFNGLDVLGDLDGGLDTRGLDNLRRVPQAVSSLGNNQFQQSHIKVGETQWWYFPKEDVNGKKSNVTSGLPARIGVGKSAAQDDVPPNVHGNTKRSATVYLSLTTCSKPAVNTSEAGNPLDLPQLEVYISQSESLQKPGPGKDGSAQTVHTAHKGYMGTSLDADGDVFVGVSAPNATGYSGQYSYEIAASIDALFHSVNDEGPFLYFLDADTNAALLVTGNLTQSQPGSDNYKQWMNITPPYTMFAHNVNDTALSGLERSYCALEQHSHVSKKTHDVGASMTNRGLGNKPKEQFYVTGLNSSSFYYGILARDGNATSSGNGIVGGGGKIWKPMNFTTKSGSPSPNQLPNLTNPTSGELRSSLRPPLLLRSGLRRAIQPLDQHHQSRQNLRHVRRGPIPKLHVLPATNPVQRLSRIHVLTGRELHVLRTRLQGMAVRRDHPALRRLLQQRNLPASPERRPTVPQRLLDPARKPAPLAARLEPLPQPAHRLPHPARPLQGGPHLPGRLPHPRQDLPRRPRIRLSAGPTG